MDRSVAHKFLNHFKQKAKDSKDKAQKTVWRPVKSFRRLKVRLRSEGARYSEYLKYYGAYLLVYGLLLNYTLHILLSYPLTVYTVPAWGIAYYFVKEEITEIISMLIKVWKGRR